MKPAILFLTLLAASPTLAAPPDRAELMRQVAAGESTWRKLDGPSPDLSARELFSCALAWCETGQHADRLDRLFEMAARMQDTDPASKGYGNFRWSWKHAVVFDFNAVDFSMRGGALLWSRHRDRLPPSARDRLRAILELGAEGCRRHKVRESYTNIALMNASNLIRLGEGLEKPEWAREGYARLERVLVYTAQAGIHEFSSPTYYGVDLDDLGLIEAFCREERGRAQARALLELFWHDIALNFFPPAGRYAGPYSRNYDYLHGWGAIETHLFLQGWIDQPAPTGIDTVYSLLGRWSPPEACRTLAGRLPRTVRQIWGTDPLQSRTHFLASDISLGSATTGYGGRMDFLLTADLPGTRDSVRCYFVPDGRGDPYGKKKTPESAAPEAHAKALHLNPFWTASQREGEALALVVYRPQDVPAEAASLESHFVMPLAAAFTVGGRPVVFDPKKASSVPVAPGEAVVLHQGGATLGLRVPWSNGAPVSLVFDGNAFGAVRLTVDHRGRPEAASPDLPPGALLWARAGSGLADDADFTGWRQAFEAATIRCDAGRAGLSARLPSDIVLSAAPPFDKPAWPVPVPSAAVLEWNGRDIGSLILDRVEPQRSARLIAEPAPVPVSGSQPVRWEAEKGKVVPFFAVGDDPQAGGGKFVWIPGAVGASGSVDLGSVSWKLRFSVGGKFQLRARVLTPTATDDSFLVRVVSTQAEILPATDWHLGVHPEWSWTTLADPAARRPQTLAFPAGEATIVITPREDGAKLDQLELVPEPSSGPGR